MATEAGEIEGGQGAVEEEELPGSEPGAEGGEGEGADDNGESSPYAPLAKDMGWVPRDQFSGPAELWKDPETFIRDGREIQRDASRELKAVREQLATLTRTSASIVEQQVQEKLTELTAAHARAVEDGDQGAAFRAAAEITRLKEAPSPAASNGPSPEAAAFAERNKTWFNQPGQEFATARAVEICNMLAAQGYKDHGTQLRIAEQRLRQEMPELFGGQKNGKPAPAVHSPGSRASSAVSNRQKGFADMPKEAQDIARDMADRGVIKSTDEYVKNYFANIRARG